MRANEQMDKEALNTMSGDLECWEEKSSRGQGREEGRLFAVDPSAKSSPGCEAGSETQ